MFEKRFLLLLLMFSNIDLFAQIHIGKRTIDDKGRIEFDCETKSVNIKENWIEIYYYFRSDTINSIVIKKQNYEIEGYDFDFKADKILFHNRYPKYIYPNMSKVSLKGLNKIEPSQNISFYLSAIREYPRNTKYEFLYGYEYPHTFGLGTHVKFKGDIRALENELSKKLKKADLLLKGSEYIFQTFVSSEGKLGNMELIYGTESKTSQLINSEISSHSKWESAFSFESGSKVEVKMKIFIRINNDGNIKIQLPTELFSKKGE